MKLKKFDDYVKQYSNDVKTFLNKVAIATNEDVNLSYFNVVRSGFDLSNNVGIPIIVSESFTNKSIAINESNGFTYNIHEFPIFNLVCEDFVDVNFIPKSVKDIKEIKKNKLKFPILAEGKEYSDEYKTIEKLRASERLYDRFIEKPIPRTRFSVLSFRNVPISIVETINKYPLDVEIKGFQFINEVKEIVNSIYEKYNNLDFYNLELVESIKGGIYLTDINKKLNLNPHQAKIVYETAYQDYYKSKLPNWARTKIFNESVLPYYEKKDLDCKLIKSKHTIDYSKKIEKLNGNS